MKEIHQRKAHIYLRILYPIWAIIGMFSLMYVPTTLVVEGNMVETTQNIVANEGLFRLGILGSLITQLLFIIIPILLYYLFKPVNKTHGALIVALAMVSVPITMYNELNQLSVLLFLDEPENVMRFLSMHTQASYISHIFWGLWLFPLGWLAFKSGYFHKVVGIALIVGGVGYVAGAFANILQPGLETLLTITEALVMGEMVFVLWIIFKGAKLPKL